MILKALYNLYDRLKDDPSYAIAPLGYSLQKIAFKIVLRTDGSLVDIQDLRRDGRPRQVRVMGLSKPPGSGINPCFLWDNTSYMMGYRPKDSDPKRTRDSFRAFKERHLGLEKEINSAGYSSVCRFLEKWNPKRSREFPWLSEVTGFGVFQISGKAAFVHQDRKVEKWWEAYLSHLEETNDRGEHGQCLITGNTVALARLHQPLIKGVLGGQAQSALVSFNDSAFESYGLQSSLNSPVSKEAAFKYATALNALLDGPMRHKHRLIVGDATVAFWTERPSPLEDIFAQYANSGEIIKTDAPIQDEALRQRLELFLQALRVGTEKYGDFDPDAEKTRFYLLALSPNAARISVRYFYEGTVRDLLDNLRRHYRDSAIERIYDESCKFPDPEFPPVWLLLRQTARKPEDIPSILEGPLLRSVLTGSAYPQGLFSSVLRRIHLDHEINYCRAYVIKGWLIRNQRREVKMSLDLKNSDAGYRLGRLFAALEKTQSDALGSVGSSVRDRFYSSASATPQSVFPRLLRVYQHHLAKLNPGFKIGRERLVQEILEPLKDMPTHLSLAEQGMFALGYYHQKQDFYRRREGHDTLISEESK